MATSRFTCDYSHAPDPLPHFWEHCVGSGHATLALRSDWQGQLRQCREELGFRHVRFHGILDDDMNTVIDQGGDLLYSFHNADQIYDFLHSIDMRPIVELSFMPRALASGDTTTFHYKGNITPPADHAKWATLVSKLASHWIERYGANEVSSWPMEVWNEPNMEGFWTGSREDYFHLFETTWKALKHVHSELTVGGPVTAQNAWIDEFLEFCANAGVPPDFISTHTYPTDARGSPDDDTKQTLSESHLGILRERAAKVRKQVGTLPLYYTEWCTSSNPRDELHDEPYAAAFVTQAMLNMDALVDAYSYWTFSDIFEENYFPSKPFQGGFGLINIHGVPKPVYRAYEILHGLGEEKLPVKGQHDTVQVWVTRDDHAATVVIVNLALPLHPVEAQTINLQFFHLPDVQSASVRRIDQTHANAKATWQMQGEPRYPSPAEVQSMIAASRLEHENLKVKTDGKATSLEITVQAQSVTAIELRFAESESTSAKPAQAGVPVPYAFKKTDEKLLDTLQSAAFRYFTDNASPDNGLVADSSRKGSAASISATGFALSCYPVAVERGWLSRKKAADTTLKALQFFVDSRQGADAKATGYKGFYYHFLDMKTGKRAEQCELSTIDTALLLAGVLVAAQYFDRNTAAEKQIRALGKTLVERVDWAWTLDDNNEVNQSWTPDNGFTQSDWEGHTEAQLMYVIGAASTSHPLTKKSYEAHVEDVQWARNAGIEWIHATPLFIHLFPQAWLDMRALNDSVVRQKPDLDYFENSRRAIAVQRAYADLNPHRYAGYGNGIWGLSACAGPDGEHTTRDGKPLQGLGYAARGVTDGPDDGTLVPWAAAASLAHAPAASLAGLHALLDACPQALRNGQFVGAINPSLPGEGDGIWVAPACYGIDQGLVVMMIENARTGLVWELTRNTC